MWYVFRCFFFLFFSFAFILVFVVAVSLHFSESKESSEIILKPLHSFASEPAIPIPPHKIKNVENVSETIHSRNGAGNFLLFLPSFFFILLFQFYQRFHMCAFRSAFVVLKNAVAHLKKFRSFLVIYKWRKREVSFCLKTVDEICFWWKIKEEKSIALELSIQQIGIVHFVHFFFSNALYGSLVEILARLIVEHIYKCSKNLEYPKLWHATTKRKEKKTILSSR